MNGPYRKLVIACKKEAVIRVQYYLSSSCKNNNILESKIMLRYSCDLIQVSLSSCFLQMLVYA